MVPIFFQKYWLTVGGDILSIALEAFNMGMFPESLNHTFILLIPKKKNHEGVLVTAQLVCLMCCINLRPKFLPEIESGYTKTHIQYLECFCPGAPHLKQCTHSI